MNDRCVIDSFGKGMDLEAKQTGSDGDMKEAVNVLEGDGEARLFEKLPDKISAEDDRRILRRIDLHLQVPIMIIYLLVALDKNSLTWASVFGIQKDAHLTDVKNGYAQIASAVYIAQAVFQFASAYAIVKCPLSIWMGALVTLWGACLAAGASADSFAKMYAMRFFLGGLESSIAPSLVALTQTWYKRSEQPWRTCTWYTMNGLSTVIGSAIAYGLGHIKTDKLYPYQIIYLTLGLITVAYGATVFYTVPDSIDKARFLTSDSDRHVARERIRFNQLGADTRSWSWKQVRETLLDLKTWCWFGLAFLISIPSGGLSSFQSLILQSFGFDKFEVMLLSIPVGALQIIYLVLSFWASTRFRVKAPVILVTLLIALIGSIMLDLISRTAGNRPVLLVAYYLTVAYICVTPLGFAWHAANVGGKTKKTCVTAIWVIGQALGNIVGPQLFPASSAPLYRNGLRDTMIILAALIVLVCITTLYLAYPNRRNVVRREALGIATKLVDYSMLSPEEAERMAAQDEHLNVQAVGDVDKVHGVHAFDDMTDLENAEFIYVY